MVYLVPAAIVSTRLLSPSNGPRGNFLQSELRPGAAGPPDSRTVEAA